MNKIEQIHLGVDSRGIQYVRFLRKSTFREYERTEGFRIQGLFRSLKNSPRYSAGHLGFSHHIFIKN